ncbi:hypothetical protein BH11PSE4_BH11PSE4_25980 [soil metagenome]
MTRRIARTLTLLLLATLAPSALLATPATVSGPAALALAAVIAPHSPLLNVQKKKMIANLFEGRSRAVVTAKTELSVTSDSINCRASNVDITSRSCALSFGTVQPTFTGRAANELFATLAVAGVQAEGAAGSTIARISKLQCTLDPAAINEKSGGGAECSFVAE